MPLKIQPVKNSIQFLATVGSLEITDVLLTGVIDGSAIATGIAAAFGLERLELFTTAAFIGYGAATIFAGLFILTRV